MTPRQQNEADRQQTEATTSASAQEAAHRQIQAAHEKFFRDVAQVWTAAQSRCQAIQTEFERATERVWQAQDPNAYQTALADYQRALQAAALDACQPGPYNDAYRQYKAAMQKAIAAANVDDLNFTDVAHIGQSFSTIWPIAMMLSQSPMPGSAAPSPRQ